MAGRSRPLPQRMSFGELERYAALAPHLLQREVCGCTFLAAERIAMCEEHATMFGLQSFGVIPKDCERCPTCNGIGHTKRVAGEQKGTNDDR